MLTQPQLLNFLNRSKIGNEQRKSFVPTNFIEHNLCPHVTWYSSKPVIFFEDVVRSTFFNRVTWYWAIHSMWILKYGCDKMLNNSAIAVVSTETTCKFFTLLQKPSYTAELSCETGMSAGIFLWNFKIFCVLRWTFFVQGGLSRSKVWLL